jgi:hypothetical protein
VGKTSQDSKRKPTNKVHSRTVGCRGWSSQDRETVQLNEGHSRAFECRGRLVITVKKDRRARGTHVLSSGEGGTNSVSERKLPSYGHSLTVEYRGSEHTGQRNKASDTVTLTNCRTWEGLIRTGKESRRERGTHSLSSAEGRSGQDSEIKPVSEWNSLPVERRWSVVGKVKRASE